MAPTIDGAMAVQPVTGWSSPVRAKTYVQRSRRATHCSPAPTKFHRGSSRRPGETMPRQRRRTLLAPSKGLGLSPMAVSTKCQRAVSMAKRAAHRGKSLSWLNGFGPIAVSATIGRAIPLEARGGGPHCTRARQELQGNQERVLRIAGIEISAL